MAKKKVEVLVPAEEQPYSVSENWQWVRLGSVCEFERGITFPASAKETEQTENNIACLRTANIQEELETDDLIYVDKSFMKKNQAKLTQIEDIIMSSANSRELVGKVSYVKTLSIPMTFGGFVLTIRTKLCLSKYLFYFLRLEFLQGKFMGESTQTTNIANINTSTLSKYAFPFPPLLEQERIVDGIESLFAKLDEAKEKAQAVVDGFEDRKAAILHKAFTGELTEEWRKKQTTRVVEWKQATFDDIIVSIKNGTTAKQNKETNNYPVTRIESLQRGTIDFSRLGYIVDPTTISEEDYYRENDIALSHINSAAHVGKTALIRASFLPLVHGMNLLRIRLNSLCIPEFFVWYSRSVEYKEQITQRINMAVNQVSINQKQLRTMPIPIPQIREQEIIVKILNENIYKLEQVKDTAEQVISQIDTMKKAILARAFRGELGTNDPTEPPADIGIS